MDCTLRQQIKTLKFKMILISKWGSKANEGYYGDEAIGETSLACLGLGFNRSRKK
jgi:hypothetical protein